MKNTYKFLGIIAAASAMSLVSCQKQEFQPNPEGTTITVNATVEDPIVTKTYVEELENAYAINWSESESMLAIAFNGNDANFASKESDAFTLSEDGTGVFTITSLPTADKTTVAGIYPSSAFVSDYENSESTKIPIELPASQKPENNSYDPNAYIMVARSTDLASIQESEVWNAYYYRASALNRFRIKNLINEGNIFSATITFSSATNAAGRRFFDLTTENPTPGEFYREGTTLNEIQLDYSDHLLATGTDGYDLWFTSWAVDLPTGESFTLSITTDNGYKYTKTFTAKQNVVLEENHLNLLTLDMTGVVPETTVTDYSGEYLIVSKNKNNTGKWVYMGDFNSSYYSAGNSQIDASKDFNTLSPRDFDNISGIENYIWIVSRTDDGYTLCNKSTGIYFKGDDRANTAYQSDSPEFHTLSLSSEGDMRIFYNSTNRYLMYNSGSPRFACYTGTQNPIYLLKWVESTEPVLIVSETSKAVDADAAEVVFEYTARNLTGAVTATVASDESQIISGSPVVDAAASTVTVTLNPNTEEVEKTATITISANTVGVEDQTLTIIQQAYAPLADIVLTFPDENKDNNKCSAYNKSWTAISGSHEFNIKNFNNNNWNNWTYIRCGSRNYASIGTISNVTSMPKIASIAVTVDKITTAYVNSIFLSIYSDEGLVTQIGSNIEPNEGITSGTLTFNIPTEYQVSNQYYTLSFDCKEASSNGIIQISQVKYIVTE